MNKEQLAQEKYPVLIKGDGQRTSTSDYDFGTDINSEARQAYLAGWEDSQKEADKQSIEFAEWLKDKFVYNYKWDWVESEHDQFPTIEVSYSTEQLLTIFKQNQND